MTANLSTHPSRVCFGKSSVMREQGIILLCMVIAMPMAAQQTLSEAETESSYQKVVLLTHEDFTKETLVQLAEDFVRKRRQTVLAKLVMVTDKRAAWALRVMPERSYLQWAGLYFDPRWRRWGMAEILRIGRDAVLRIRYSNGSVDRLVVKGRDPTDLVISGEHTEILYVHFPEPDGNGDYGRQIFFYVRTPMELSRVTCHAVVEALQQKTGLRQAAVLIRNDPWFITNPGMPVQYRFWEEWPVPGPVEFIESRTALSGWGPGGEIEPCSITYPTRPPKYSESVMYGGGHRE